ncbi:MAG: DUF72 domain-containing protein, partial [candidate division Zixibacteria bacterium]|nr:DUF72 domain-containing protein [candidate division Zixibacteria bacterium]
ERDKFLGVMDGLGIRLGPLILQFPYFNKDAFSSAAPFMEKLDRFLEDLPNDFKYGVEIRNPHWLKKEFVELCRKYNVALVLVDQSWMPHGDEVEKMFDPVTTDFTYIRLLGDRQKIEKITKKWDKEVLDYSERMNRWVEFLHRMVEREIFALVYANNHYAGHAPMTARRMREMFLSND